MQSKLKGISKPIEEINNTHTQKKKKKTIEEIASTLQVYFLLRKSRKQAFGSRAKPSLDMRSPLPGAFIESSIYIEEICT
jgi:hypothetical protein